MVIGMGCGHEVITCGREEGGAYPSQGDVGGGTKGRGTI